MKTTLMAMALIVAAGIRASAVSACIIEIKLKRLELKIGTSVTEPEAIAMCVYNIAKQADHRKYEEFQDDDGWGFAEFKLYRYCVNAARACAAKPAGKKALLSLPGAAPAQGVAQWD